FLSVKRKSRKIFGTRFTTTTKRQLRSTKLRQVPILPGSQTSQKVFKRSRLPGGLVAVSAPSYTVRMRSSKRTCPATGFRNRYRRRAAVRRGRARGRSRERPPQ